jgi:hypothetical protein
MDAVRGWGVLLKAGLSFLFKTTGFAILPRFSFSGSGQFFLAKYLKIGYVRKLARALGPCFHLSAYAEDLGLCPWMNT